MQSTVEPAPAGEDTEHTHDHDHDHDHDDDHDHDHDEVMATSSTPATRVKLHVVVTAAEFDKDIDAAFKKLAGEVRIPGFRPGKAPRQLLEKRLGTEIAREQALQDALPQYYVDAVNEHDVDVIAPPEIAITSGQEDGDVEFDAIVEVRPQVRLLGYDELRIELPITPVGDDDVDKQVDALRDRFADLEESDLPLIDDAYATIDISGTMDGESIEGLTANDFLYKVGSGMVVPELDEQLHGSKPGAILEFDANLPERFGENAGDEVHFRVMVKDAKTKVLPDITDEWASEASEFDTVDELRDDIRKRLEMVQKLQAQMAVRDKVLEAAAEIVPIEPPSTLVENETRRRIEDLAHRLSHQGMQLEAYLQATGQEPQAFIDEVRASAVPAVLADLALRAVVTQEEIAATDEEVDREIERIAERAEQKPAKVRRELERSGALEAVRSDVARGKALEFLVEHAKVVDENGNEVDLSIPSPETDSPELSADEDAQEESQA